MVYRNAKVWIQFLPGETTQNDFQGSVRKRIGKDIEVFGWVQNERRKAPIYKPGAQSNPMVAGRIPWFPHLNSQERIRSSRLERGALRRRKEALVGIDLGSGPCQVRCRRCVRAQGR